MLLLQLKFPAYAFNTDDKTAAVSVLMAQIDPANAGRYNSDSQVCPALVAWQGHRKKLTYISTVGLRSHQLDDRLGWTMNHITDSMPVPDTCVCTKEHCPCPHVSHLAASQGFFGPYLSQTIPHTARGSAVPYHYGSFRPTTQVLRPLPCSWWHTQLARQRRHVAVLLSTHISACRCL